MAIRSLLQIQSIIYLPFLFTVTYLTITFISFFVFLDKCSFEDTNICGFSQLNFDDFDWTRQSMSTGSRGTGPSSDHTYGTARGILRYHC